MPIQAVFGLSVAMGLLAWSIIAVKYIWPALAVRSRADALRPLALLHAFRFVGLSFLVPGVVSPDLPRAFSLPAAYGDLATSILALLSLPVLGRGVGIALTWVCNILGALDLLYAFYQGNRSGLEPGSLGAAYFIPTVLVPLLLVAHVLAFRLLLRKS
jgi:hypothetical protein